LKSFPYALPVYLVRKVGKPDEAHKLFANYGSNGSTVLSRGDQRRVRGVSVAICRGRSGVSVTTGISVRHLGKKEMRATTRSGKDTNSLGRRDEEVNESECDVFHVVTIFVLVVLCGALSDRIQRNDSSYYRLGRNIQVYVHRFLHLCTAKRNLDYKDTGQERNYLLDKRYWMC
jgi:hypothetical protein